MSGITIKSAADIEKMDAAGRIVEETLNLLAKSAAIGMTTQELDDVAVEYIKSRGAFSAQSMAGIFAAKEAFVKALGRGFDGVRPRDIGIRHTAPGAPYYEANESAREALILSGVSACHLSISHDGGQALAFAVLEG